MKSNSKLANMVFDYYNGKTVYSFRQDNQVDFADCWVKLVPFPANPLLGLPPRHELTVFVSGDLFFRTYKIENESDFNDLKSKEFVKEV